MALLRESDSSELMRNWIGLATEDVAKEVGVPAKTVNGHLADVKRTVTARSRAKVLGGFDAVDNDSSCLETAILHFSVKLATEFTSVSTERYWVDYLRISGETVIPLGAGEGPPAKTGGTFPLSEHPFLSEMVATRQPRAGVLRTRRLGKHALRLATEIGIVAGGGVPIRFKDSVHGILSLSTRGVQPSHDLLQRLASVARIIELALLHHH